MSREEMSDYIKSMQTPEEADYDANTEPERQNQNNESVDNYNEAGLDLKDPINEETPKEIEHSHEKNKNVSLSIKRKITEFRQQQIALEQLRIADVISVKSFRKETKALAEVKDKYLQKKSIEMSIQLNWKHTSMKKRSALVRKYISRIVVNFDTRAIASIE